MRLSNFQQGLIALVGIILFLAAGVTFAGLIQAGVILKEPVATSTSVPVPTATAEPTPEPELLGSEDRRACGLYWESYEYAIKRSESGDRVWYFADDIEVDDKFITLRDGCRLEEYPTPLRGDNHSDFDIEQFRVEGVELYHNGVKVAG